VNEAKNTVNILRILHESMDVTRHVDEDDDAD